MEHELWIYPSDWPSLAQLHSAQTRQILLKLLPRRILVRCEVVGEKMRYCSQGEAAVGRYFSGLVGVKGLVSPTGFEPVLLP